MSTTSLAVFVAVTPPAKIAFVPTVVAARECRAWESVTGDQIID